MKSEKLPLKHVMANVLEESRMVLPGATAFPNISFIFPASFCAWRWYRWCYHFLWIRMWFAKRSRTITNVE